MAKSKMRLKSADRKPLTAERARELLDYDPDTGCLTWKAGPANLFNAREGMPAGTYVPGLTPEQSGRLVVKIEKKKYYAHRVIWLIVYGEWPVNLVDHKDGDATNNRLSNLRTATAAQNVWNSKPIRNAAGYPGICRSGPGWNVRLIHLGKRHYLGTFKTKEAAAVAYKNLAAELRGEFQNNRVS